MNRALFALAIPMVLFAQTPYGRLTGRVTDPTGAVIPGVTVRAIKLDTNAVAAGGTNAAGNYDFPNLVPGEYRLEAEAGGFKSYSRSPLELRVGDVVEVEVRLEIGSAAEQITVTAETPLLDSVSASLGQVVDSQRIVDLPIAGGNPLYLTQLSPGVIQTTSPGSGWLPQGIQPISNAVVAGTANGSSEFLIDGAPNMSRGGMVAFAPPPEMVQEFRVQTAPFDASVGHFSGGSINMVLKSGTNAFHGTLNFSHLSRPLMTRPFFINKNIYDLASGPVTKEKIDTLFPYVRTNRYRATASGPVYIPKVHDGRNRTFWTFGFDWLDRAMPEPRSMTVPTASERSGDFSALLALGSRYQIYDPDSITPAPNGRTTRQPLPGNKIPASSINRMATKILGYYALPNAAGDAEGRNNYFDPRLRTIDYKSEIARLDHQFSDRHHIYASVSLYQNYENWGKTFHNDALGMQVARFHRSFVLDDVYTPGNNMVLNTRYVFTRLVSDRGPQSAPFDLASLGLPPSLITQLTPGYTSFPSISIDGNSGYTALGGETIENQRTNRHVFMANVSTLRGNQGVKFGGEYRVFQANDFSLGDVSPVMAFAAGWTKGPNDNSPASPIGQGMASFLYGYPTGGSIDKSDTLALQSNYAALFVHDEWRVGTRLTVNAGLRWELNAPLRERYNRMNRGFDFTATNPIQEAARAAYAKSPITQLPVSAFQTRGGLLFAGFNGVPRALLDGDYDDFSPRIGLAYKASDKMVVRGGYGVYFITGTEDSTDARQLGYTQVTSLEPSVDLGVNFRATLSNPFPDPLLLPFGASAGLKTYLGSAIGFIDPTQRAGYMQRWTVTIQRQLPSRVVGEIGYLGNRATGLAVAEAYGTTPAQYLSTSPFRDQPVIDVLSAAVPNPFLGMPEFAGSAMTGKTVTRAQLLSPYPHFSSVSAALSRGTASFHALMLRAERRMANGYTIQTAYTFSKNLDRSAKLNPTDPEPTQTISALDRTHRVTASGIFQLPFGRGRRWGAHSNAPVNAILGGWSIQGIYLFQSGQPLAFGNIPFYGDINTIPLPGGERTIERWFNTGAGFDRDSKNQLASNLRTFSARFASIRGPGISNIDLSIFKTFRIGEKVSMQLRAEGQNAVNHPLFPTTANSPGMNPFAATFGQITQGENEQRRITLSLKMLW